MTIINDFIVELGTEELPPLSLEKIAINFHDQLLKQLLDAGLEHGNSFFYATPRRLAVIVNQLSMAQADKTIDRQGPTISAAFDKEGKPTAAANGFAQSCGVSVDDLEQQDSPKGPRLSFQIKQPGKTSTELLPELVKNALGKLPITKAMRWGNYSESFIRPVKWLLMLQGSTVIPCTLFQCKSNNITHGHRFMAAGDLALTKADEYLELLENHYVIADIETRKATIRKQVIQLADEFGARAVIDTTLLDEVTALVEWPVALAGEFDKGFLSVPKEALISTMAHHQKYFHLEDEEGRLLPRFITIANVQSYLPETIVAGNEKVIRPRLADAMFFFEQDSKHSLSSRLSKLKKVVFQKQLGSLFDKTLRIKTLASGIANLLSITTTNIETAAAICKSDLLTDMVSEFPALQGIMGRYYAAAEGQHKDVALAMDEIYMPRFAGDQLPTTNTGICLALADRLDTLAGIFAIGQRPSGNKDPFALRRSSLGVLRIIIEKRLSLDLTQLINMAAENFGNLSIDNNCKQQLADFFAARLKAMYLEQGFSNTVIQAVQSLSITQPLDINARIIAVDSFDKLPEAQSLAQANKRVSNILSKNIDQYDIESVEKEHLAEAAEQQLFAAINKVSPEVSDFCDDQNYSAALTLLAELKPAVDDFFDSVMVMDDNIKLRQNRLALLQLLQNLFIRIADISCLQKP